MAKKFLCYLILCWLPFITPALGQGEQAIITAENIHLLQPVLQYDFSVVEDVLSLRPASGIFAMNADATIVVSFANAEGNSPMSTAIIWEEGENPRPLLIGDNPYHRVLAADGQFLGVARADGAVIYDITTAQATPALKTTSPVLNIWFTELGTLCGETAAQTIQCQDDTRRLLFNGQAADFARIGRIPAPLAITISPSGLVSLWNMEHDQIIHQAESGDLPVFGSININGSPHAEGSGDFLAWRDPESNYLYLLDFNTGENRQIAPLYGDYITHLRLSRGGDVIVGINPLSAAGEIWAWQVETGEKFALGAFRVCNRAPDLAYFSDDGTALVLGCDTGIEIWRIKDR